MTVRIALDAGHGINTPGKRTPDGEREWSFNNVVLLAAQAKLQTYKGVEILRTDDPTGKTDVPLITRTNKANAWKADVFVSLHHNALTGKWGAHGGVETFTFNGKGANPASPRIANAVNPLVVSAMGLRNRGVKKANLHVLREANMPAILVEGGFMDSTTDIGALRSDAKLRAQGEAIAEGLASYYKLKRKGVVEQVSESKTTYYLSYGDTGASVRALQTDLNKLGYKLVVDGSFGPTMRTAVREFQSKYKLVVDGSFGPASQAKLADVLKPAPKAPAKTSGVYRVIVDGKQVGAFGVDANVTDEVAKALRSKAKEIRIQKV